MLQLFSLTTILFRKRNVLTHLLSFPLLFSPLLSSPLFSFPLLSSPLLSTPLLSVCSPQVTTLTSPQGTSWVMASLTLTESLGRGSARHQGNLSLFYSTHSLSRLDSVFPSFLSYKDCCLSLEDCLSTPYNIGIDHHFCLSK